MGAEAHQVRAAQQSSAHHSSAQQSKQHAPVHQTQVVPPLPWAQASVLPLPAPQLHARGYLVTNAATVAADSPEHSQHLQDSSGAEEGPHRDAAECTEQPGPPTGWRAGPEGLSALGRWPAQLPRPRHRRQTWQILCEKVCRHMHCQGLSNSSSVKSATQHTSPRPKHPGRPGLTPQEEGAQRGGQRGVSQAHGNTAQPRFLWLKSCRHLFQNHLLIWRQETFKDMWQGAVAQLGPVQTDVYFSGSLGKALHLQLAFPKIKWKSHIGGQGKGKWQRHHRLTVLPDATHLPRRHSFMLGPSVSVNASPMTGPWAPSLSPPAPSPSNPSLGPVSWQSCQRRHCLELRFTEPCEATVRTHRTASLSASSGKGSRGQAPMLPPQLSTCHDMFIKLLQRLHLKTEWASVIQATQVKEGRWKHEIPRKCWQPLPPNAPGDRPLRAGLLSYTSANLPKPACTDSTTSFQNFY